jgi:multidrug efflux pump subunit AcrA (membrane-fusion protein)
MSAEVRIKTGEHKGVLLLSTRAIVTADKRLFCFLKDGDKLVERELKTGATDGTRVEVTDGLKAGDTVLADPAGVLALPKEKK